MREQSVAGVLFRPVKEANIHVCVELYYKLCTCTVNCLIMKYVVIKLRTKSRKLFHCGHMLCFFRVGNGSWVSEGVRTVESTTNCGERVTTVQCASTHLTSFAVLVDVAGGLRVSTLRL